MVKLRLKRMGKKKQPIYRIIAADSRSPRDGRFIEEVGFYDPNKEPMVINLKEDKVVKWIKNGAQPTDTVKSLLKRSGLSFKMNLKKRGFDETKITEEMQKFEGLKEDKLKREKERKVRRRQHEQQKSRGVGLLAYAQAFVKPVFPHQPTEKRQTGKRNDGAGNKHFQYMFAFEVAQLMGQDGFQLPMVERIDQGIEKNDSFVAAYARKIGIAVAGTARAVHHKYALAVESAPHQQGFNAFAQLWVFQRSEFVE